MALLMLGDYNAAGST